MFGRGLRLLLLLDGPSAPPYSPASSLQPRLLSLNQRGDEALLTALPHRQLWRTKGTLKYIHNIY